MRTSTFINRDIMQLLKHFGSNKIRTVRRRKISKYKEHFVFYKYDIQQQGVEKAIYFYSLVMNGELICDLA